MSDKLLLPIGAGIYPAPKWDFFNTPFSLRGKDEKMENPTNKSVDKLGSNDILRLAIRNYAFCD